MEKQSIKGYLQKMLDRWNEYDELDGFVAENFRTDLEKTLEYWDLRIADNKEELDKAREEGFDNGVEKTVNIIQRGLDELLLEKGEEKYWVGDILRDCGSSVEKILPQNMKHYKSKLNKE